MVPAEAEADDELKEAAASSYVPMGTLWPGTVVSKEATGAAMTGTATSLAPEGMGMTAVLGDMKETLDSGEVQALKLFHRRYNKVLLDKLSLEREHERLMKENEDLKSVMRQVRRAQPPPGCLGRWMRGRTGWMGP